MADAGSGSVIVNPQRLASVLHDTGWRQVGGRRNVYSRFAPPGSESDREGSLVLPLDTSAPEYVEMMAAVLAELASGSHREMWERVIAPRLAMARTDQFRFRKESAAPRGLIAWRQGEHLIDSARATLVAGAKAFMEPGRRHFSNAYGQFASRYLDAIFMGQTAIGSYVVTALAPADAAVPMKGGRTESFGIEGVDTAASRSVTSAVVKAVEATVEALEHHRSTGSFSAFDDRVSSGVSLEMTSALRTLSRDADEADITVEWDPLDDLDPREGSVFTFRGGDAAVLETVGNRFAAADPGERATLVGRVHLLTKKEAGGPGIFGMETFSKQARRVRVRLAEPDEYHRAVRAHDEDLAIRVAGNLTREGTLSWLYNASVVEVLGSYVELRESARQDETPDHPLLFEPEE